MKLQRIFPLVVALFLAASIFFGIRPPAASASQPPCPDLIPSGSYPSGFGSTLGTFTFDGYLVYVCSNSSTSYLSSVNTSYGRAFQCVELANRFAANVFGTPASDWSGDAWTHWTTSVPGWHEEPDASNYLPEAGDLIVWGSSSHTGTVAGHIAVISSVSRVNSTTWNVTAANQNTAGNNGSMIAWTYGTITRVAGDGLYWYSLVMQQSTYGSVMYGVMHY